MNILRGITALRVPLGDGVVFKSKQSYYNLFRRAGIGWKRTQAANPKKSQQRIDQKRQEIKDKLSSLEEEIKNRQVRVFFQDESHLLWGNILGYVWGKYAERISVSITNTRKKQTYYGALDVITKEVFIRPFPSGNTTHTIAFVKYLLDKCPNQRIILIWDGASYHSSTLYIVKKQ